MDLRLITMILYSLKHAKIYGHVDECSPPTHMVD